MRGFTPHPSRVIDPAPFSGPGQCPGPNSGCNKLYLSYSFPVKQSTTHTYFCREQMCFCELGAALLHADTHSQRKIVFLRIGCTTGATQKPLCKRNIVILRVGCGTATRRNPFTKEDCAFANWMPALRATGWRCETPPTGCFASGENEKKPVGKCTFLTGFFLHFHSARGLSFRFPKFRAERSLKYKFSASHKGCRADGPAAGGTGAA